MCYRKEKGVEMEEQTQVKCAEREQPTQNKPLFSRQMLIRLIIPLVIEQFLLMSVGMADTVLVRRRCPASLWWTTSIP